MFKITFLQLVFFLILFNYINAEYVINNQLNNQSFSIDNNQPKVNQDFKGGWSVKDYKNFDNYLHFNFYHQLIIKLDKLQFEFDQINLSFDYFIFNHHNNNNKKDIIEANFNVIGDDKNLSLKFDEWGTVNIEKVHKRVEDFIFKLTFRKLKNSNFKNKIKKPINESLNIDNKKEIDKLYLINQSTIIGNDNYFQEDEEEDHPIYIKNLKLTFTLPNFEIKIIDINDELFKAIIDDKEISENQLIHFHFLPKLTDEIKKYYFTFEDDSIIDWSIINLDSDKFSDICIDFKYQATKNSLFKLKIINKEISNRSSHFTPIELDNTEIFIKNDKIKNNNLNYYGLNSDNNQIDYQFEQFNKPNYFQTIKWTKIFICLRDLCPGCNSGKLKKEYNLKFEASIQNKYNDRFRFLAITDIDFRAIKNDEKTKLIEPPDYLTNWQNNGSFSKNEWKYFTDDMNFELETDKSGLFPTINLKLNLIIKPYMGIKKLFILSEWIQIRSNTEFKFDIESQFDGAYYKILILNYKLIVLQSTEFKLIEKGSQTAIFKFTDYIISLLNDKPARIKILLNYKANEKNVDKNLFIKNLYYADPCNNENLCNKKGVCKTLASNTYECKCSLDYSGSNCQFQNHCKLTGDLYCLKHNATACIPNDNTFICECNKGFQWNGYNLNCEKISNCLFKICKDKNEVCDEKDGIAFCRCKTNYVISEKTGKCQYDLCKNQREEEKCGEYEKCVTVLGERKPRCICPLDHKILNQKCLAQKKEQNPFVKQLYGCQHTYIVINNEIHCQCFKGYKLADDRKSCIGDLSSKCKKKCNHRQICVSNEFSNDYNCQCLMGFSGINCETNYCDIANKEEIHHICGTNTKCVEKRLNSSNSIMGFSCDCHKQTAEEDHNGFCKLKDVCSKIKDECNIRNGNCIPKLDFYDKFLNGNCICSKGRELNENKCESMCNLSFLPEQEKYKTNCQIDFKKNERKIECDAGFLLDKNTNECIAGGNLIQINFDFKYKNLVTTATEFDPPINDYLEEEFYCNHVSFKEQCIETLNNYRQKEHQILEDKNEFFLDLKFKIFNSIYESLKILIDPNLIKRIVINKIFKKNGEDIDFKNDGLNEIYTMDLIIEIDNKLKIDTIKENFKKICLKDEINLIEDYSIKKSINTTDFITTNKKLILNKHCVIRPYLYIINSKLKVKNANLCDLNYIKCAKNSKCKHTRDIKNETSNYSCKCSYGFESRLTTLDQNIEMNICTSINQCIDLNLNDCDPESTECENLYEAFRCNCKENFEIVNRTHCSPVCKDPTICKYGKCEVFEKNYHICICNDGYKGTSCSRLDNKVVNLKTLLVTITIILILSFAFITLMTYIYIKKVQVEDKQKLLKKMIPMEMDDLNFNKRSFEYDQNIDLRNMSRQNSFQQNTIQKELEIENTITSNF